MKTRLLLLMLAGLQLSQSAFAADIVWTNVAGGNWNATANWSPNQVPVAGDNVFITNAGTYTVTLNVSPNIGSLTLGGPSGTQTLTNSGSVTLTLTGSSSVAANGRLGMSSGTLAGAGPWSVSGILVCGNMAITDAGLITIETTGTLNLQGNVGLNTRTMRNAGTVNWGAGNFDLNLSASFTNLSSGTFNEQHNGANNSFGGTSFFVNQGLWRKTTATGTTTVNIRLLNQGTFEVQSGTVLLNSGSTNSGTMTVSTDGTLTFGSSATHAFLNGSVLSGAGTVNWSGTSLLVNGDVTTGTNVITGTVTFNSGGTIMLGTLLIPSGTLAGTNDVTVTGPTVLGAASLSGSGAVFANGGLSITNNSNLNGRTLVNPGTAVWSGGNFDFNSANSTFSNLASATFTITHDGDNNVSGGTPRTFVNAGLVRKTAGLGTNIFNGTFLNLGTVEVQTGGIGFNGGGTNSGAIDVSTGATMGFGGGTFTLLAGSLVSGGGDVGVSVGTLNASGTFDVSGSKLTLQSGTANFSGSYNISGATLTVSGGTANFDSGGTVAVLNVTSGTLGGSSAITVTGPMTWGGGTITGSDQVNAAGSLSITGNVVLTGRTLNNSGNATWSAGNFDFGVGGTFSNLASGIFDITHDGDMNNTGGAGLRIVANAGTFRKISGSADNAINPRFLNFGTVEVQSGTLFLASTNTQNAGVTRLNGGNIRSTLPMQILGGSLTGRGTVTGVVFNAGSVNPGLSPGLLNIIGSYTQTVGGTLAIEIAGTTPETAFDRFTVSGTAALNGILSAVLTTGFYPGTNASFGFLTAGSIVGTFASFAYPSNSVGMEVRYTATTSTIVVTNVRPSATNISLGTVKGGSVSIPTSKVLLNTADPDLHALNVSGASTPSHGSAMVAGGFLTYTPSPTYFGADSFTYIVSDPGGLTATGVVSVAVSDAAQGPNVLGVTSGADTATVQIAGIPGAVYRLQYTTDLSNPNWQNIGSDATASSTGIATLIDPSATDPQRFYRTLYISGP